MEVEESALKNTYASLFDNLSIQTNSIFDFLNFARLVYTNNNATLKDANCISVCICALSYALNGILSSDMLCRGILF